MRLDDEDPSNVEDRRGSFVTGGRLGIGGILVLGILSLVFKENFFALLGNGGQTAQAPPAQVAQRQTGEEPLKRVAVSAFNDAQKMWAARLRGYRDARLVLFWDETQSGCGGAAAEMGPFYCPSDEKVYIDLGFYRELSQRFGAPGEFAQAYVIAHEMGHHVQKLLGISARVPRGDNAASVRLELQADCFAGIWGHSAAQRNLLDPGDAEQGLRAAAAVGDDRLQKMAGRRVSPDSFTHGSSADRSRWFRRGLQSGQIDACDTFRER